jgi:hypothetical protein
MTGGCAESVPHRVVCAVTAVPGVCASGVCWQPQHVCRVLPAPNMKAAAQLRDVVEPSGLLTLPCPALPDRRDTEVPTALPSTTSVIDLTGDSDDG